ncbi:sigma-70 family RNA polymerase sigma factor [Rhodocaloribacter sp.]
MTNASSKATVTRLLLQVRDGNSGALNDLFPLVYETLYELAHGQRRRWHGDYTINTTALLHEAYLKLVDQSRVEWKSRSHFLAVSARAMRHILINYAQKRKTLKRGGDQKRVSLDAGNEEDPEALIDDERLDDLLALHEALTALGQKSERQVRVVECRFFGDMTIDETAAALDVSPATVKRDWALAQAWLFRYMKDG